jgi:PAS domain S-box-containing protein
MAEAPEEDRSQAASSSLAWLTSHRGPLGVAAATLGIAGVLAGTLRTLEASDLRSAAAAAQEVVLGELQDRTRGELAALERLAGTWGRRAGMERSEFEAEAEAGAVVRDLPFLESVAWLDPDLQLRWQAGADGEGAEIFAGPSDGPRSEILEAARETGETTISQPVTLPAGEPGFIAVSPLYVDERLDGYLLSSCSTRPLFQELLRNVAPGFAVRIRDGDALLYVRGAEDADWAWAPAAATVSGLRPRWSIQVAPGANVVATYRTHAPLMVAAAGAVLALALAMTANLARSRRGRTERLVAEARAREGAERELSRVIERIPDHIWSGEVTPEGYETIYFSSVLRQITGSPAKDFEGALERWYARVHEADLDKLQRANREVLLGQIESFDIEYRIYRADGSIAWLRDRVQAKRTARGRRLDGIVSDITDAKRAEAERLRSEQEALLSRERQRMTREMHDGLGGQLVSTIAMLETGRSTHGEIAESLRRALDDMRIAIDSLDPSTTDLTTSLGRLRARLEPLLKRNGVKLRWRVEDVPRLDDYRPEQVLHLLRIIQEAVTNAMQHAAPDEVRVGVRAAGPTGELLSIEIRDDGCGLPPGAETHGRGISHMKSRAKALEADLHFDSGPSGTRIELRLAMPRPGPPGAP